jgi:predicted kinase
VSGAPGAGKSSLAGPLAAELGFALITKDTLKETLHDALGAPEPDLAWSRLLGGAAMELLWRLAADAPAVVIEANFRPYSEFERGKLTGLAALGGRTVEVHCRCPAEVAAARYSARRTHPVHVLTTLPVAAMAEYDRPVGIGGSSSWTPPPLSTCPPSPPGSAPASRVRRARESAAACRWCGGPPGPRARAGRRRAGTRRRS